jgi:hypothetical protein
MSMEAVSRKCAARFASAVAVGAIVMAADAQLAGSCYTAIPLTDQAGNAIPIEPVCRVLEQNLNQFCEEPPLVCGLKISPQFRDRIERPVWTPVSTDNGVGLVESIVRAQWGRFGLSSSFDRIWEERRPIIEESVQEGRLRVSSAAIDLFQVGRSVEAYRIDPGDCEIKNAHILEKRRSWDERVTEAGVRVVPTPEAFDELLETFKQLSPDEPYGDILLFGGTAYTYRMSGNTWPAAVDNRVVVDQGINDESLGGPTLSMRNVCEIRYRSTGEIR